MPLTGVINYVCHFLWVVLWNIASIYIGFWIYCNILVEKKDIIFSEGPQYKKVTGAPDGCVTPLDQKQITESH